jgi:hypothetical protein
MPLLKEKSLSSEDLNDCVIKFLNQIDYSTENKKFYGTLLANLNTSWYRVKIGKYIHPIIGYGDVYISFAADYARLMSLENVKKDYQDFWDFFEFAYTEVNAIYEIQNKRYCCISSPSSLYPEPTLASELSPFSSMDHNTYIQFFHYGPIMKRENDRAINEHVFDTLREAYKNYHKSVEEAYEKLPDPQVKSITSLKEILYIAENNQIRFKNNLKAVVHWRKHGGDQKAHEYFKEAYETIVKAEKSKKNKVDKTMEFRWYHDKQNKKISKYAKIKMDPLHLITYFIVDKTLEEDDETSDEDDEISDKDN